MDIVWEELALCKGLPTNLFFDDYEANSTLAKSVVDPMCLSCPVMKQCLQDGMEKGEQGVRGGIFLMAGKPDEQRNAHKTPEVWERIRERLGNSTQ